ncbi:MAG: ABC transporter ATP-binding protein [Alphaproteobacteria bacterium]|nr:ABC transporter ATP-binding protein [Alphaproteobacteria bacterium]
MVPPAVSLIGIDKRFGAVHANRAVDLTIARGSIAGIVGENGAGKSTLMSILYGFYAADAGEIRIRGRPVSIRNSSDAIALGIGMVHQHFMLVDTFTVLENVMLGAEGGAVLAAGLRAGRATLERLERDYGLGVDPDALVGDLPVGAQQRVEILKALYRGAEILILDEPTGVLTPAETEQLFRILRTLKARGTTVILITHKLREIMAVTDRVVVMRAGAVVAERDTAATTIEELAELMVGRKVRLDFAIAPCRPGPVLLKAEHLRVRDGRGVVRLDEVSFELRAGEIVGVAGVSGNGQTELLEVLSGIRPLESGRLTVGDRVVTAEAPADPAAMRALGLAHVPEDRHRLGLVTAFAATESSVLGYQRDPAYVRGPFSDQPAMSRHCAGVMERYDVRPRDPKLRSAGFSGGNQQKLILGRELNREPKILLAGQPTRGLDIGAIEFVHRRLIERRDAGCAVLLVSVELEEILSLSDRILVMCGGRIAGQLDRAEADERKIGLLMAGAQGTAQAA